MIRAAVIGLGWWGRHIVNSIKESDKIKVVRLVARRPSFHREFAEEMGVPLNDNYASVLKDPEVDAVILVTPHSQHYDQVQAAIASGKQIFCEKPLALTRAFAQRMVVAAQTAGLILGVGHERRFEPAMEKVAQMVLSGELGTILHAEANFSHNLFRSLEADNWRGSQREAPGAGMTGMGVHLTDLLISMLGPVEAVVAQTAGRVLDFPTGDIVNVQLKFQSGVTAFVGVISSTPYYSRFTIMGDRMWTEVRDDSHPQHGGAAHLTTCGKDSVPHSQTFSGINTVRANLEEWADAVLNGTHYRFTDDQRIGNVAVLEAIVKSAESGTWVGL